MRKLAVVAFGGNALLRSGQKGTYQEQIGNVEQTCESLCNLLKRNYNIVIGHGNGPQVGNVMLQHEEGKRAGIEAMPMDFCVAETQGSIAYLIEMGLRNVMARHDIQRDVVTLVTQVAVNGFDPMFKNPTKPVGPYYTQEQAEELAKATGAVYKEDPKGRGWRKVVASPKPTRINNIKIVEKLAKAGHIVVTVGGGLHPLSSGTSHSAQYALAAIFKAVNDGVYNFRDDVLEYGRKARLMKDAFLDNGFTLTYDKDLDEPVADGFYFTYSYPGFTGADLLEEMLYYGISAISLDTCGSEQQGIRACTSLIPCEDIPVLRSRLELFRKDHPVG